MLLFFFVVVSAKNKIQIYVITVISINFFIIFLMKSFLVQSNNVSFFINISCLITLNFATQNLFLDIV